MVHEDVTYEEKVSLFLADALMTMQGGKPNDRSAKDRAIAIAITDLEKVIAWWDHTINRPDIQEAPTNPE